MKMKFYTPNGTLFADSYQRVVIGGKGAYIEFSEKDIKVPLITKKGQEYRGTRGYSFCKYFWLRPEKEDIKVYHQRGTVTYADYKVGYYYVSPDDLNWDGELYAEKGNQPGEAIPTTYTKE